MSENRKVSSIMEWDATEAARQFTLLASELYRQVPSSELVGGLHPLTHSRSHAKAQAVTCIVCVLKQRGQ